MSSNTDNGYSSIPREEGGDQTSSANASVHQLPPASIAEDNGMYARLNRWWAEQWGTKGSETAPLINRQRMTLEAPKKSNMRIAFEIVGIVGAFTLIAAIIVYFLAGTDDVGGKF